MYSPTVDSFWPELSRWLMQPATMAHITPLLSISMRAGPVEVGTDVNGIVEMTTIYYIGRAPHTHLRVYKDWIQSESGSVRAV